MSQPNLTPINYVLVADAATGRRCRRWLAEHDVNPFVRVGTWVDLLAQVEQNWLITGSEHWSAVLPELLQKKTDAFWSASLEVAPDQVANTIDGSFQELLSSVSPEAIGELAELDVGSKRIKCRLRDLLNLRDVAGGLLPRELHVIRSVLSGGQFKPLRPLRVIPVATGLDLNVWQSALVDFLNHSESESNNENADVLVRSIEEFDANLNAARADSDTALGHVQRLLFRTTDQTALLDGSMQFVSVRDPLEEVESAVGMVQSLLESDNTLMLSDIGLCVPDYSYYAECCVELFELAGLPLSGLSRSRPGRDIAQELLFYLLYVCEKPSPVLATCSVITNPLMPWSAEIGQTLVRQFQAGRHALPADLKQASDLAWIWQMLIDGCAISDLPEALDKLANAICGKNPDPEQQRSLEVGLNKLRQTLNRDGVDWHMLRTQVAPRSVSTKIESGFNVEGVTIWQEESAPWRPVKHLIALGFSSGYYPSVRSPSVVFSAIDRDALRGAGVNMPVMDRCVERGRSRFRQQLCNVAESVTFMIPHYSVDGSIIPPSESLQDFASLVNADGESGQIILDVDSSEDRKLIRGLAVTNERPVVSPEEETPRDLELGQSLLGLRKNRKGEPKPESPSGLEGLIVSPLAWLLRALNAEPVLWEPENFDVMLQGSAAHSVFENLFVANQPLPDHATIEQTTPQLLKDALQSLSPFLMSSQWAVERDHLETSVMQAALAWRDTLERINGEIIVPEVWLEGHFAQASIHGQADALVRIGDDQLVVVDYKKSSSGKFEKRMKSGHDLQATLYRTMLKTGGPKGRNADVVREQLEGLRLSGIVYFTLNDQKATADFDLQSSLSVSNWYSVGGDVASEGLSLLRQRLKEVSEGTVAVSERSTLKALEKAGVTLYALDNSPLAASHVREDEA